MRRMFPKSFPRFLAVFIFGAARMLSAAELPAPLTNEPIIKMLVPGFTVVELPIQVTALNNIEYAPDGRLFAAGYDGRFHLFRDTDGDGLEDKVDTFSAATSDDYPLGMVVKDGMPHALLSDEIVRFRDTNGDGVPDRRETVLKGWDDPDLRTNALIMHRRVDSAMGLVPGPNNSWYITMGSANPGNGYWQEAKGNVWDPKTRKEGKPQYSPDKMRGCLLRLSPDGTVEMLATGLRYIMSLQTNALGDLFGTDQEGATWLPNGNPFDELLHIQTRRHYGFPPAHPDLLPDVVDEPSTWNFAPQHQSTCGFRFNGPLDGRKRFGPESWAGNALVTGASRGKLWRTAVVKTAAGYVARADLIASIGMLAIDCAISPAGDLVVCCHAGPPDWGSGPAAVGKLFKIRYTEQSTPQPLLAWVSSPTETVVSFDRKLDAAKWSEAGRRAEFEYGKFVGAADRWERFRPGYAVVQAQQKDPRHRLPVKEMRLGEDRRSLVFETEFSTEAAPRALSIPSGNGGKSSTLELACDLSGVEAAWNGGTGRWKGWLPHPDLMAARGFTSGSATHETLWKNLDRKGALTLRGQLDLWNMLRPATQIGAKLDYVPEPETVTVTFRGDAALSIQAETAKVERANDRESKVMIGPRESQWIPFQLSVATPLKSLDVSFTTARDSTPRPLGVKRFWMPFAKPLAAAQTQARAIPEIAEGNWDRGRALFQGKATCAQCHQMRGQGFAVGPDLGNTTQRDYASVLKDIREPSATINPDAIAYTITLRNGEQVTGVRGAEDDGMLQIKAAGGLVTRIAKADIVKREANAQSLMPAGLLDALSDGEIRDLLAFLLLEPPPAN
jgi:putative heme-binding domain-containing protein